MLCRPSTSRTATLRRTSSCLSRAFTRRRRPHLSCHLKSLRFHAAYVRAGARRAGRCGTTLPRRAGRVEEPWALRARGGSLLLLLPLASGAGFALRGLFLLPL